MENMEKMKKKEIELRAIFVQLQKVPADKIDYAAGVVAGLSIAYDSMFGTREKTAYPKCPRYVELAIKDTDSTTNIGGGK